MKGKSTVKPVPRSRGRPRAFDADAALDQAMRVFWKHGYEGASLPALTRAMNINRPSLYAAFGNKESLFRKALDRYAEKSSGLLNDALAQPTARAVAESLLRGVAMQSCVGRNRGCLLVQGALACGEEAESVRRELAHRRAGIETALRARFLRAVKEGDLAITSDPAALARYVAVVIHGMAVQSSSGARREELLTTVEVALRAFPA